MTHTPSFDSYLANDLLKSIPCGRTIGHGEVCDHPEHCCDACAIRMKSAEKLVQLTGQILKNHTHEPNTRCTAQVKPKKLPIGRPPGPANPPIWCHLPAGHEGPHRCNHGGMSPSYPFRPTDEVIMREPGPGHCKQCRTSWPCQAIKDLESVFQPTT